MWDFQSLLGAGDVNLEGGGGLGPPLSDGDWTLLSGGLGLVRGRAGAFQHPGSKPGEAVAAEELVRTRHVPARCVPSPQDRVGGRSGRPPASSRGGEGGSCRVSGAGPVGREGGRG